MADRQRFLHGIDLRPASLQDASGLQSVGLALGSGPSPLEVVVATADRPVGVPTVRAAWKSRHRGRAAPVMLAVLRDHTASLCGPTGDDPAVYLDVDAGQAERICREALQQPDRHAALRYLRDALPAVESRLPGLRNEGFLATHELSVGARALDAWEAAEQNAKRVLNQTGDALLRSLGFRIEQIDQVTSLLRAATDERRLAVAVLLRQHESPELQTNRFSGLSPVSYALAVADRENIPYVLISQGSKLRLYPVKVGVGVGRRGRTETYVEIHTSLLRDADAAYLWLLFSADALVQGGTLDHLITESGRFAGELAENLRERIYFSVVPKLAEGLARARELDDPTAQELADTYEMAMTVLFRLLFIAYAEDKDLLPYKHNGLYRDRSLKKKAQELLQMRHEQVEFDDTDSQWREIDQIFRAVEDGKPEWGIPAYDGGLFSRDPEVSRVGADLAELSLPNTIFGNVLFDLLCIQTNEGWGPVDFRSLGVREFGTIYEGLLESELSVAETNLAVDDKGFYRPARAGEEVLVREQHIYLHNRSGARKSTGSYFTKAFAVEHLLDQALEPALQDHLARLDAIEDKDDAAVRFFDFRVADIAMGSAHFLVAAVDHIERALTQYLSRRPLPGVRAELVRLRESAEEALGSLKEQVEIEDTQLLRRLIARRCIYGVDMNPVAVNLARLSIWIHTFVPGLPLSLLDHNLVVGNSLVGIGRIEELQDIADPDGGSLFTLDARAFVGEAMKPLDALAKIADATAAEVRKARKAMADAKAAVAPASALCDIATAARLRQEALPTDLGKWEQVKARLWDSRAHKGALAELKGLQPFHFPVAFPEVFLRERSGFDAIIGNPPWEEVMCDVNEFWGRHIPGFRGLAQRQQEELLPRFRQERRDLEQLFEDERTRVEGLRDALTTGPYPGMQTGHPDLYKAFCWRFWHLTAEDRGRIGVVLPRDVWVAKGSTDFRLMVLKNTLSIRVVVLINRAGWVFPGVHEQNPVPCLNAIERSASPSETKLSLWGPFRSLSNLREGILRPPSVFLASDVCAWTDTASLPLLPTAESLDVFVRLRSAPRLDADNPNQWRARPIQGDLNATWGKPLMDFATDCPRGFWPVYKGESFELFDPDRGDAAYYAWADPKAVVPHLQEKRLNGKTKGNSVWNEFHKDNRPAQWWSDEATLPCFEPRIAFRDVTNRTNRRSVIAALVPPKVILANQAPYLLWPRGDVKDEAFLLGVLSSLPLDWYARRFLEKHLNFFILNPFPIPRPTRDDPMWQRTVELAGRLAAIDDRFEAWAKAVGVKCGPLAEDDTFDMICTLDAAVAHLYGLEEKHLSHVFETFHEGWRHGTTADHATLGDYDARVKNTLKHFKALTKSYPTVYQRLKPLIKRAEKAVEAERLAPGD